MPLLPNLRQHLPDPAAPHLTALSPRAAIPGACFELTGTQLLQTNDGPQAPGQPPDLPEAFFGDIPATLALARPTRALVQVPTGAISSELTLRHRGHTSNALHASIGVPMVEDLHMISNPAVDAEGNLYAMVSGPRGQSVPVSIYRIARDLHVRPFVTGLTNVSALAFGPDAHLYASSRSEGAIYRISPSGAVSTFAEGMGIATGLAFDAAGNLFVGDRSGTIFKLSAPPREGDPAEIFVFALLEPSVAFYHLCFRADGTLLVTAPTTSSHQPIYAIDPDGNTTTFFRGLGRPQGMAFDVDNNLYVAASLEGNRGIVRIATSPTTNKLEAELVVAGNDLVGLCFLEDGCCALATNNTIFHADLGITGKPLI
jgi:outer membrane protein assembly factor BamB